jgi:hypothetical protein
MLFTMFRTLISGLWSQRTFPSEPFPRPEHFPVEGHQNGELFVNCYVWGASKAGRERKARRVVNGAPVVKAIGARLYAQSPTELQRCSRASGGSAWIT